MIRGLCAVQLVHKGCPLLPLLYALETFLCRLKDRACRSELCRISLLGKAQARVSTYAVDVTIFVLRWYRGHLNGIRRLRGPRLTATSLPACSWSLGRVSFRSVVQAQHSAGEELVGGPSKGRSIVPGLVPKAVVFKGRRPITVTILLVCSWVLGMVSLFQGVVQA